MYQVDIGTHGTCCRNSQAIYRDELRLCFMTTEYCLSLAPQKRRVRSTDSFCTLFSPSLPLRLPTYRYMQVQPQSPNHSHYNNPPIFALHQPTHLWLHQPQRNTNCTNSHKVCHVSYYSPPKHLNKSHGATSSTCHDR